MNKYVSPFGYPDEQMRLLGIIAAHWESAELVLEMILAQVMSHTHGRVALLTSNLSFNNKLDLLTIYARDALSDNVETAELWREYNRILTQFRKAYAARNRYVHAQWQYDAGTNVLTRKGIRTKNGKLDLADEPTTPEMMVAAASEINEAGAAFVRFFSQLGIAPQPPDKSWR